MIQDIKRLLFFQKTRTFCSLLVIYLSLNFITPFDTGHQFEFLKKGQRVKKISHIGQVNDNSFVLGRAKNGLTVVGFRGSSFVLPPLLKHIDSSDLVVAGSRQFQGQKEVRINGQDINAFFIPMQFGKKVIAFTSFSKANELLDKKQYFSVDHLNTTTSLLTQTFLFLVLLVSSAYFVYIKLSLLTSLDYFGVQKIKYWILYLSLAFFFSLSLNIVYFFFRLCLLSTLLLASHVMLKKSFLIKNCRGVVFE